MIKTSLSTLPGRSRLVGLLTELSATKLPSAERNLAERLGHLVGLSGPINLANDLRRLPREAAPVPQVSAQSLQEDLLANRERMMNAITASFVFDTEHSAIEIPNVCVGARPEALLKFEPYQRFYAGQQIEMAVAIDELRDRIRNGISGISAELHQLAELDRTLEDNLLAQTRNLFSVTPKLLEQHFKELLETHQQENENTEQEQLAPWLMPGGWLDRFYQKIRELLLAELEVRLQPAFGLMEALHEHSKNQL